MDKGHEQTIDINHGNGLFPCGVKMLKFTQKKRNAK